MSTDTNDTLMLYDGHLLLLLPDMELFKPNNASAFGDEKTTLNSE